MSARGVEQLRQTLASVSDATGALASVIDASSSALALHRRDGTCVFANAAFDELFGAGRPADYDIRADEALIGVGVAFWLRRAFAGETIETPTFWFDRRSPGDSGVRRRVALSAKAFPLHGGDGGVEFVVTTFHDRTDALLLEEQRRGESEKLRHLLDESTRAEQERRDNEEQMRAIFEQCSEGVMITDDEGRIIDMNPAGCDIVGRGRDAVVGTHYWLSMEDAEANRLLGVQTLRERHGEGSVRLRRPEGDLRDLDVRAVANFLPGRHLTTFRDVTERNEIERALRQGRQHLQLIIDSAPVGITYLDADYRHVFANAPYARRVGRSPEELVGMHVREVWGPERFDTIRPQVDETLRGRPVEFEVRSPQPEGGPVFVRVSHVADLDEQGNVRGVVVVITDITELKRTEERLRESQRHLVASQRIAAVGSWELDLVASEDALRSPLRCSDECYRIFGYEPDEIEVTPDVFFSMLPEEDRESVLHAMRDAIERRRDYEIEHRIVRRDRSRRVLQARAEILFDRATGRPLRFVGTIQDVTEREKARRQIETLNEELEKRVAERTAELAEANRDLESFAYSVSHDLRAPLRAINGYAQIVLYEQGQQVSDETRHVLARIEQSARRMDKLIDDLLSLARLGRQALHLEVIDVHMLVEEVIDELGVLASVSAPEIDVGDLPECRADRGLLKQVFVNLLGNAIKFTRGRRTARIEVRCAERRGRQVWSVRDNGVGFDNKYAKRLFGVFERLHASEEYDGTGVGLAIVERIVKRHGGEIWAEGDEGKGAAFFFTL